MPCSCARPTSCTTTRPCRTPRTPRWSRATTRRALLDLVFTVGQYHLVSMALNTFRAERDDDVTGVPIPTRE